MPRIWCPHLYLYTCPEHIPRRMMFLVAPTWGAFFLFFYSIHFFMFPSSQLWQVYLASECATLRWQKPPKKKIRTRSKKKIIKNTQYRRRACCDTRRLSKKLKYINKKVRRRPSTLPFRNSSPFASLLLLMFCRTTAAALFRAATCRPHRVLPGDVLPKETETLRTEK